MTVVTPREVLIDRDAQVRRSLTYRELDATLKLMEMAGAVPSALRRGKNTRYLLTGLLHRSMSGPLGGYEDINDAERKFS